MLSNNIGTELAIVMGTTVKKLRKEVAMGKVAYTAEVKEARKEVVKKEDNNRAFLFDLKTDIEDTTALLLKEECDKEYLAPYKVDIVDAIDSAYKEAYIKAHKRDKTCPTNKNVKTGHTFHESKVIFEKVKLLLFKPRLLKLIMSSLNKRVTVALTNSLAQKEFVKAKNFITAINTIAGLNKEQTNKEAIDLQLFANTIQKNKNVFTPKGNINILTITANGWDKDAAESSLVYSQSSTSEMTRALQKEFPLVNETRYMGNETLDKAFNNFSRYVNNIQDSVLVLYAWACDKVAYNMRRLYVTNDGRVFVKMIHNDELDENFLNEDYPEDDEYAEIMHRKIYKEEDLKDIQVKVYECLLFSPSQTRKEGETSFKVAEGKFSEITEEIIKTGEEKIEKIINIASDGMLNILKKKGLVPFKKSVKLYARLSQIMAPSTVLGLVNNYGLILDKDYMAPADGGGLANASFGVKCISKLYGKNVHLPIGQLAGQVVQARPAGCKNAFVWTRPNMLKAEMNTFAQIKIRREDITTEIQSKLEQVFDGDYGKYAPVDLILKKNKLINKATNKEYIVEDDTLKTELLDSFKGNGRFLVRNDVLHLAYIVLIGDDKDVPDFITDLNGFKAAVDFTIQSKFVVLDQSKEMAENSKLSMQMLSTLLLKKKAIKDLKDYMIDNINEDYEFFKQDDSINPTIESMQNFYLGNYMQTAAKHFSHHYDSSVYRTMCNNFFNRLNQKLDRFNLNVKHSTFARLAPDWSYFVAGSNLLKEGECYSKDANEAYIKIERELISDIVKYQKEHADNFGNTITVSAKSLRLTNDFKDLSINIKDANLLKMVKNYYKVKKNRETIVFRSPKIVFGEFGRFKAVSLATIEERINKLNISDDLKETLIQYHKDLKEGSFILAGYEKYKDLLGGADFDFDGIEVVCDQRFIKMMQRIKPMIVSVVKAKVDTETSYRIGDFNDGYRIFARQAFNVNMSVGEITNMNQLVELLLYVPTDKVVWLLKRHFIDDSNMPKKEYKTPLDKTGEVIEITPEQTEEIVERIKRAKFASEDEIKEIIIDLNIVLRSYQERTIDAAKSGEVIKVLFNLLKDTFLLALYDDVSCRINWNKSDENGVNHPEIDLSYNEAETKIKENRDKFGKKTKSLTINDVFHDIKKQCILRLKEIAEEMIEHEKSIKMTERQVAYLKNIGNKYGKKYMSSLLDIVYRYNEANAIRIAMSNAVTNDKKKDDKDYREDKDKIKLNRKTIYPEISKHFNETASALTNMIRTMFSKYNNVETAAFLKYVSCGSTDNNDNIVIDTTKNSSICHMLLPEEYALLTAKTDDDTVTTAKSRIYMAKKYKDGEQISVINGVSQNTNDDNRMPFLADKNICGNFTVEKDKNNSFITRDINDYIDIKIPEKKQLVLKLSVKKGVSYKSLYNTLQVNKNKTVRVSCYSGKGTGDSISFIDNGVLKPCAKFAISRGCNVFNTLYNGFQGKISSINYYATGKYENLLVVLNEAVPVEFRNRTAQEIKDSVKNLKDNIKNNIKNSLKNDIKNKIKDNVKNNMKPKEIEVPGKETSIDSKVAAQNELDALLSSGENNDSLLKSLDLK